MAIDENYNDSVVKPVDDGKDVEEEYAEKVESEKNADVFVVNEEVNDDSTGKPVDIEKYVKETADSVESI